MRIEEKKAKCFNFSWIESENNEFAHKNIEHFIFPVKRTTKMSLVLNEHQTLGQSKKMQFKKFDYFLLVDAPYKVKTKT